MAARRTGSVKKEQSQGISLSAASLQRATMASREKVTSAFAPYLDEVRAWLQKMIATLKFVEMVTAIIALIARMRDLNT
jgi:hypothetical protein